MKSEPAANLVYRHNRVTRSTHWINALALMILFMSGLQIFNAHPHLYWGSTSEPDKAFFSIGTANDDGDLRGIVQLYGVQFDTTGYLGVQPGVFGPSARAFPSWLTVPGYYSLAAARRWHFFFGWLFAVNGLLYVIYNLAVGHLRKFFFTLSDAKRIPAMIGYYLRLRKQSPQQGDYNPLQKIAYTSVLVVLTPLLLLSGMAMSPQLDVAFHWLPALFGGRQSARAFHFILAFALLFFVCGHVFMVLTQGVFNNMRSMTTGWYREKGLPVMAPAPAPLAEKSARSDAEDMPSNAIEPEGAERAEVQRAEHSAAVSPIQKPESAPPIAEAGENKDAKDKT